MQQPLHRGPASALWSATTVNTMPSIDVQSLLDAGTHKLCPVCRQALIRAAQPSCQRCSTAHTTCLPAPACAPRRRTMSGRPAAVASTAATFGDGTRIGDGRTAAAFAGGLSGMPAGQLWVVAHGVPITQGSVDGAAGGRIKRHNGPQLHAWRNTITARALAAAGSQWVPVNGPVRLSACFTVPWPTRRPFKQFCESAEPVGAHAARLAPLGPPDVDKLLRALQDALSPHDKDRFRVLADDARVVDVDTAVSFPRPEHTHQWALPTPGVVARVELIDNTCDRFPRSTLCDPGGLPQPALDQHTDLAWARR